MGSIINIYLNKNCWRLTGYTASLRTSGEEILEVVYGSGDFDYEGPYDLTIYMRKSVYDKVMSGEYSVAPGHAELRLLDKHGNPVQPLRDGFLY